MDIEQLYRDFGVIFVTEGHKHCREGWVQVVCPFCTGNPGYHLGYNTNNDRFVCWRCGGHYSDTTLMKLLGVGKHEVNAIMKQYGALTRKVLEIKKKIRIKEFKLPTNLTELKSNHIKYLIGRNFDPVKIIKKYGILGSSVHSKLDKIIYKHRIIIPFIWEGNLVSFDSRDITDKAIYKYMACSEDRELIPHKAILYGNQDKWKDIGICVEGPTDVWRMGNYSFAVSGIKYTPKQVRCMGKIFKRIFVLFDDDPQASLQANKLVADLQFRGVDAFRVDIKGDPGALPQKEADYLVKQLILK